MSKHKKHIDKNFLDGLQYRFERFNLLSDNFPRDLSA